LRGGDCKNGHHEDVRIGREGTEKQEEKTKSCSTKEIPIPARKPEWKMNSPAEKETLFTRGANGWKKGRKNLCYKQILKPRTCLAGNCFTPNIKYQQREVGEKSGQWNKEGSKATKEEEPRNGYGPGKRRGGEPKKAHKTNSRNFQKFPNKTGTDGALGWLGASLKLKQCPWDQAEARMVPGATVVERDRHIRKKRYSCVNP